MSRCEDCGTEIIRDCYQCGAQNCCPKCFNDQMEHMRMMDHARLQGRLEAFAMAMTECGKAEPRNDGYVGGRTWVEVRKAIYILHLHTLSEIKEVA